MDGRGAEREVDCENGRNQHMQDVRLAALPETGRRSTVKEVPTRVDSPLVDKSPMLTLPTDIDSNPNLVNTETATVTPHPTQSISSKTSSLCW